LGSIPKFSISSSRIGGIKTEISLVWSSTIINLPIVLDGKNVNNVSYSILTSKIVVTATAQYAIDLDNYYTKV
jgi:hypothetical protein